MDSPTTEEAAPTPLSLPPELLTKIISFCGRTFEHVRATPSALLQSCRRLYELGRSPATRVEFLVTTYGTSRAFEASGLWLRLLNRDVVSGLARRCHPVPRYQLQRLYQRCANAFRTDLHLPILVSSDALYPPPAVSSSVEWRPGVPAASLGFCPDWPDDVEFEKLAFFDGEALDGWQQKLVEEGRSGGWAAPDDPALTAMLTLKNVYGLGPDATMAYVAKSSISAREDEDDLPLDSGIEGARLSYALLQQAGDMRDEGEG
ncbi:hypothetical protein DFJ74DRAFT_641898 [Hyaloraphidium curvatum]|nr:hypothetical protein DFJ74DRAFT_641898 [Hyaloraphidium curvatum]